MSDISQTTGLRARTYGFGTFALGAEKAFPGLVKPDGEVIDLSARYSNTHALLEDWDRALPFMDELASGASSGHRRVKFSDVRGLKPLAHPNLLCAGANYKQHAAEMLTRNKFNQHNRQPGESDEAFFKRNYALMEKRGREGMPFFWTGLHSSLVGARDDVLLPAIGNSPDWELELGVVVARSERYVGVEEADRLIAGYTIVNDIGTVDEFRRSDIPWGFDWVSKHQPTFKVAGPFIVPKKFVDVKSLRIHLEVNGKVMQDWPVDDMIFSIPQLLSYASERINLTPGDLLLTGSPPGNGAMHGRFLADGDVIDGTITGLGAQRNVCRTEVPRRPPTFGPFKIQAA